MAAEATLTAGPAPLSAAATRQSSDRKRTMRRVMNPLLIAGGIVILILTLFVLIYPMISPYNPRDPDFLQPTFAPSSWAHPLGTDNFGRDTLTRLAYGGRTDIIIGLTATRGLHAQPVMTAARHAIESTSWRGDDRGHYATSRSTGRAGWSDWRRVRSAYAAALRSGCCMAVITATLGSSHGIGPSRSVDAGG